MFSSGWLVVFDGGVLITIAYIYIYICLETSET